MSFRARRLQPLCEVLLQGVEDDVGQSTLEAAHRLEGFLALGALAQVEVLPRSREADLDERGDVQGVVEAPGSRRG